MALTPQQLKFVAVFDGSATEAAKKAGYSAKTAHSQGPRLMQNPEVLAAIQAREDAELAPAIATRSERQAFWTAQMRDAGAKPVDRLRASELLGRSNADFTDKVEVKGELTIRDLVREARTNPVPAATPPSKDPVTES